MPGRNERSGDRQVAKAYQLQSKWRPLITPSQMFYILSHERLFALLAQSPADLVANSLVRESAARNWKSSTSPL